jgi:elongation factor Ts
LVEINSETDFVAKNDAFQEFVKDICMQVAASHPQYVTETEVPAAVLEREKDIYRGQMEQTKKPANVIDKIVEGKVQKFFDQTCLLRQAYIKDPKKKVSDLLKELVAKVGENCQIRRFARFELGEGLEKKQEDFASEVAKQVKG